MSFPISSPYGSWLSPITADLLLGGSVNLSQPRFDGDDVYWLEGRPAERGRNVVVRLAPGGAPQDVTPPGFSARTRVHEYGGGDYAVHDGTVYFANDADQRLYRQRPGQAPQPLTPAVPRWASWAPLVRPLASLLRWQLLQVVVSVQAMVA